MAKKSKTMAADKVALLNIIIADTNGPQGYSLVNPDAVNELVEAGRIQVNPSIKSEDGKIAARATDAVLAAAQAAPAGPVAPAPVAVSTTYNLQSDIPMAPSKRGGKKSEEYPFSKMEIGQSFVVPSTPEYPEPWNTFASTVSSATRRFSTVGTETKLNRKGESVPVLIPTRKFTLRRVEVAQTYANGFVEPVAGARVFRTA
jgi:hypothetical protein